MILKRRPLVVCFLALLVSSTSGVAGQSISALHAANARVSWDSVALRADFDGDGKTDYAHLGRAGGRIYVGIVFGGSHRVEILDFAISGAEQRAICGEPATLVTESADYDPATDIGPLPGFRRSKTAKGLRLSGGDCDPVHMYWDHDQKHMNWWRH